MSRQIAQADERFTDEIGPLLESIAIPTMVVWGVEDEWIPVDRAARLAEQIPGAQVQLIERAGHLIHLDAPDEFQSAVVGWLARQPYR